MTDALLISFYFLVGTDGSSDSAKWSSILGRQETENLVRSVISELYIFDL